MPGWRTRSLCPRRRVDIALEDIPYFRRSSHDNQQRITTLRKHRVDAKCLDDATGVWQVDIVDHDPILIPQRDNGSADRNGLVIEVGVESKRDIRVRLELRHTSQLAPREVPGDVRHLAAVLVSL